VHYLAQLGAEPTVRRNDEMAPTDLDGFDGVLTSPGPSTPESAGVSVPVVAECARRGLPLFGVCLGHQAIGVAFGATVTRAGELLHGKTSEVHHKGVGVLEGMPDPFTATRYHSLAVVEETLPVEIEVTARTASGVVMAMRHTTLPIEGVQFHPESVLTESGHVMLANWLAACGDPAARDKAPALAAEMDALRHTAFTPA
jgi:para-aminobenzoate synthetase component 2